MLFNEFVWKQTKGVINEIKMMHNPAGNDYNN